MFTGFNCDAIADSLIDGQNSNTITVIPTDNLTRSFPVLYEPRFLSYSPVASSTISKYCKKLDIVSLHYCINRLTVEIDRAEHCMIALVPRVFQHSNPIWLRLHVVLYEVLTSNKAARFCVRIPRENLAFLHDLEAYHELESTQISFA